MANIASQKMASLFAAHSTTSVTKFAKFGNRVSTHINNASRTQKMVSLGGAAALVLGGILMTSSVRNDSVLNEFAHQPFEELSAFPVVNPNVRYGFALDTFTTSEGKIKPDQIFERLLGEHGISTKVADSLAKVIKESYDFSKMQDGKPYLFLTRDVSKGLDYFIFEPDAKRYIVFTFNGATPTVREVKREVVVREMQASGTVEGSLWETMVNNGMSYQLADMVEDALKYQVDLRSFQDGDEYKIVYEEELVDGKSVGVKKMTGAYFKDKSQDKEIFAIYYDNGKEKGWYSKTGLPMKDGFLKSPLKYAHITSHYNLNRLHPVLGYVRPHFGTDYAAPHGTPIMSVADGTVEAASSTSGNGNFVKIRHMKPYESQYLHMSRFASGIRAGTKVKQGDIIGYVGSTGLATGPHVCFRFWKNGSQVNHLKEKLPMTSTFSSEDSRKFKVLSSQLSERFAAMSVMTREQIATRNAEKAAGSKVNP